MKSEWCSGGLTYLHGPITSEQPNRRRTRCPKCNRLLILQQVNCEESSGMGDECWHERIPPHKVKINKPRMPNRKNKTCRLHK